MPTYTFRSNSGAVVTVEDTDEDEARQQAMHVLHGPERALRQPIPNITGGPSAPRLRDTNVARHTIIRYLKGYGLDLVQVQA